MDVVNALSELHKEKKRLDLAIAKLEAQQREAATGTNGSVIQRGRKSMSAEERRAVSQRMANYWAARKIGSDSDLEIRDGSKSTLDSPPERDQAIA